MVRIAKTPAPQRFSLPSLPGWARLDAPVQTLDEATLRAGAALAALDARVHAEAPFAGVWRRRLALKAAAASTRIARRSEDEARLRDAFFLRHGNDDPGPAGRMLIAWRALDRSTALDDDAVLHVASILNLKVDNALQAAIAIASAQQPDRGAPFAAAETARVVLMCHPDAEILALWLADAVLATRLKWALPLPLLAGALLHPSLRRSGRRPYPGDSNWMLSCTLAYARAAAQACDLFAELERNSQKLLAVERRLRTKGAKAVIEKLHDEDAVAPSARIGAISDRGLRRLFERLVALGAVRELTGRSAFRLYGL